MKKICEFLNCKEEGIYPAPRSREDINSYKYYCIEHIRDFNKSWNSVSYTHLTLPTSG